MNTTVTTDLTPPFTVHADAALTEDGAWEIDACVVYRDGVPPAGDKLMRLARPS